MDDEFTQFVQFMNQMRMTGNHIDLTQIHEQYLIPKEKMAQMSGQIYSKLNKKNLNKCLFPGCNENAILSHSIQRSLLETIADKTNHVYQFSLKAEFTYEGKIETVIEKIGINKASTFYGYCVKHDTELFLPIENSPIQNNNLEQQFLLLLRALNKEYHDSKNSYFRLRDTLFPLLNNYEKDDVRVPYIISHVYLRFCEYNRIEKIKEIIDTAFFLKQYTVPFTFKSKIIDMKCPVFVSTFFSIQGTIDNTTHDIDITQDLPYYFSLTVLPVGNNQTGVFYAFITEQANSINDFLLKFEEPDITKSQLFLTDTILRNSQNFYLSSDRYESMGECEKTAMTDFFYHTVTNRNYENTKYPNLFI